VLCGKSFAQGLPLAAPQTVGMSAEKLNQIDALVEKDIADKKLPGAVVLVGHKGKIVFREAYGNRALLPQVEKMTVDTIFDVASLTKVVATTTSVMILIERGQIRLSDTIGKFIPEIADEAVKKVTIQQLLTHTSGFAPDFDLRESWGAHKGMIQALVKERLRQPAGTKFVYSDIGFIVLGEIVQRISKNGLSFFFNQNVYSKLNYNAFQQKDGKTFFNPLIYEYGESNGNGFNFYTPDDKYDVTNDANYKKKNEKNIAPTEWLYKEQNLMMRGQVHDPTAFRMGGVAGHAGLFSTGDDLARFCQMLLNGGTLDGKRILSAQTVARMTAPVVVSEDGATRGLGWDMNSAFSSNRGDLFPLGSFGHTGFTGTSIWIDRVSNTFVVFLSNRVHPNGKGDVTPLRARVATVVASALEDTPVELTRLAENIYWSQVGAQIPKFKENLIRIQQIESLPINGGNRPLSLSNSNVQATVLNGIDVLEKNNFKELNRLRVGLVTNHTGRNLSGKQTIDVLFENKTLKLVSLFAPEHGIRGLADEKVSDSVDDKTGLPIYSLYGESRRPKPEQLKDLDAIVFDIQDIGVRFYTYEATLLNVLEEAAKAGKPVFVLDRPNPIGGEIVEGAIADADKLSFVVSHTVPVRHGLTIGEFAQMVNAEKKINADLRVVKMENWQRSMWFDQTNQTFVNPSPNMRSLTEATLYPGIGLLETTNLSVGRGTDTPFEIVGAPFIDGQKLAAYLNDRNLSGVRFVPVNFKPNASVFKNEMCGGINVLITNRTQFSPIRTGIEIAVALRKLYPNDWKAENYNRLLANAKVFERVKRGDAPDAIEKSWQIDLLTFTKRRASFLLYK